MSFIQAVIKNPTRSLFRPPVTPGTTITQGYVLVWASGLAVQGDSSATPATVIGVANETQNSSSTDTTVSVIETFERDVWIANSTNNSNAAHNGQYMVLGANAGVVNNTGTTASGGIVQQVGVYGPAANKQILVRFVGE